jgi:hypothetical protein
MKTVLNFVLVVVCLSVFSCKNDEVTQQSPSSSITSNGVLSVVISKDSVSLVDTIKAFDYSGSVIGKAAVPASGVISLTLGVPNLTKIGKMPAGMVCSDTTAMYGDVYLSAFKKGVLMAYVFKSNYNTSTPKAGNVQTLYKYTDRAVTFNGVGTEVTNDTVYTDQGAIDHIIKKTSTYNYSNVKFNKGWNELVLKINSYATTTSTEVGSYTFSNTIPTDLKWKCIY